MSFSEDVRRELVARPPAKDCCRLAFLSGLIRHSGSLQVRGGGELAVVAELAAPAAARLAFSLLRDRGGDCEILSFREHRFQRRNRVLLRIRTIREERYSLFRGFFHGATDTADAAENVQPRLHSVRLTERASAVGKSFGEIALGDRVEVTGVRRRGARSEVPQPQYRFEAGDILVLLGRPEDLASAEKTLLQG